MTDPWLHIEVWRWVAFYFEVGAAALAIGWWRENRKTITLKRRDRDWK
jgi:hypothetical protein